VRSPTEVVEALQAEHVERTQTLIDELDLRLVTDSLQDLGQGDIGERDSLVGIEHRRQSVDVRRVAA
jgi:hypothetical protein